MDGPVENKLVIASGFSKRAEKPWLKLQVRTAAGWTAPLTHLPFCGLAA